MSYADAQPKIILNLCRHDGPDLGVKIYTAGATRLDEALISQPDPFTQPRCRVIKSEKKIRVGFMPMHVGGEIKNVYVKQHNALTLGHRLAAFFLPSAAMRSLAGALTLLRAEYDTAKPVAAVEYRRRGVLIKSLYFSEEVRGAKTVDTFWRENLVRLRAAEGYRKRRAFLRALAHLLKSLHKQRLYHNDLKASNILIRKEQPAGELFSLIDLQGLKRCLYVSKRRRIKNLAQLGRTLGRFLSHSEKLFFLNEYGDFPLVSRRQKRALMSAILEETERQMVRENHHCFALLLQQRDVIATQPSSALCCNAAQEVARDGYIPASAHSRKIHRSPTGVKRVVTTTITTTAE
jgi:serine/threonine protein kinase